MKTTKNFKEPLPEYLEKMNCNVLCKTEGMERAEWLKYRQLGIGGSDIASMLGMNPFHSPLAFYWDKVGKIEDNEDENVPAEVGIALEPFMKKKLSEWLSKNKERVIVIHNCKYILQHPENKIALANLDGVVEYEEGYLAIAEYKTTSARNYKNWEGENIPDYYYLQTQWYLYVTGLQKCYLAFLIGNQKFDVKIIERNDLVIEQLVKKTDEFWNTFIIPKVPPSPDGSMSSGETIKRMYPGEEEGKVIDITSMENQEIIERRDIAKQNMKESKLEVDYCDQFLKVQMKDSEKAICSDKLISWTTQDKKEYIVKASKSRVFRIGKYKVKQIKEEN